MLRSEFSFHRSIEACDYVINGKPALEWVMERQAVTTDKKAESSTMPAYGQPKPCMMHPTH
ncbi:MAG: hypothetical protein OEX11_06115 [Nitrosomonas sp.]|nr:hypothetical protein [Nitrosomonas sp.]